MQQALATRFSALPQRPVPHSGALRSRRCCVVVRAEQTTKSADKVETVESVPPVASSPPAAPQPVPTAAPSGHVGLAIGSVAAAVVLFAATHLGASGAPTLATLEQMSTPLDAALVNGRPTMVEFYASWCEVCRGLVPEEYELEKQYQGKVNFVMLNIENSKWAPEAAEFGVRGIPHFVFFDSRGEPQAAAVGRVPRQVLDGNLQALVADAPVPFGGARGLTSDPVPPPGAMAGPRPAMPRDHA